MRSCLVTQCRLAPRGNRAGTTNGALAFTTTVGVIVRVHYRTADCWADAFPAAASSLTKVNQSMLFISNNTDSCTASSKNHANFA